MIGFEPFLKKVLPRVEGAPRPAVHDAIRTAIQEFCVRTRLWRETDTFKVNGHDDGLAAAPHGAVIFEIEWARFNEYDLEPQSISWLDDMKPTWRQWDNAQPEFITQTEPDTVRLVPRMEGTLELGLYLKPSDDGDMFPDWLADRYREVIKDGALAELYSMPGQAFTSLDLAMFHTQKFESRLDAMYSNNLKGQQKARVRSKPFYF